MPWRGWTEKDWEQEKVELGNWAGASEHRVSFTRQSTTLSGKLYFSFWTSIQWKQRIVSSACANKLCKSPRRKRTENLTKNILQKILCAQSILHAGHRGERELDNKKLCKNLFALNQFQPFVPTPAFNNFIIPPDKDLSLINLQTKHLSLTRKSCHKGYTHTYHETKSDHKEQISPLRHLSACSICKHIVFSFSLSLVAIKYVSMAATAVARQSQFSKFCKSVLFCCRQSICLPLPRESTVQTGQAPFLREKTNLIKGIWSWKDWKWGQFVNQSQSDVNSSGSMNINMYQETFDGGSYRLYISPCIASHFVITRYVDFIKLSNNQGSLVHFLKRFFSSFIEETNTHSHTGGQLETSQV